MSLSPKSALAAAVLVTASLVVGGIVLDDDTVSGTAVVNPSTLSPQVQSHVRAGRLGDGGLVYLVLDAPVDGGQRSTIRVTVSPCAWRPTGVSSLLCRRTDGSDPGDGNTMQPGQWLGVGCVRKSCVVTAGDPDDDELLPVKVGTPAPAEEVQ